jgi:hypothetical protein
VNRRQRHYTADPAEGWRRRFEKAGFAIEDMAPFLSRRGGELWSVLAMHVFRLFGVLKLTPDWGPKRGAGVLLEILLRRSFTQERVRPGEGYLLLVARRVDSGAWPLPEGAAGEGGLARFVCP